MESTQEISQLAGEAASQELIEALYERAFPAFLRFAASRNVPLDDVRDILHDALIIYFEKCRDQHFEVHISPEAYVTGIGKHLWVRKFKNAKSTVSFSDAESVITIPEQYFPSVNEARLLTVLERTGRRCLELLRRFYYEKMNMNSLATALGYRTAHSVAVQKFKCLNKMRDFIRSKSMNYEDFVD